MAKGMESKIERALTDRIQHFKDNSDSLTMGSVRRLLEKDMGLETYALDAHKKFIKTSVEKLLEDSNDVSLDSGIKVEGADTLNKESDPPKVNKTRNDLPDPATEDEQKMEDSPLLEGADSLNKESEPPKVDKTRNDLPDPATEDEQKMEDSPVMGLMTSKSDAVDAKSTGISEKKIKKAVFDRASHIIDNSETITMGSLRRLLEEDMALPAYSLDPFKKFIRSQIDEVLESSKVSQPTSNIKKAKTPSSVKNTSETKSRKRASESGSNKKETIVSNKKQKKPAKSSSDADADNMDEDSDVHSESSAGNTGKAKQVSTPSYGQRVEKLKIIIKACGLGIAPVVYKRAKTVSDEEREAFLIKELKGILSREGLSANPTDKEIKEVKRRKQKEKELEGIDMSNIVTSSRRRSRNTYVPPARVPKPKLHDESESDEAKSVNNSDNDEDEIDGAKSTKKKKDESESTGAEATEKEQVGDDVDNLKGSKEKDEEVEEEQEGDDNDQEENEEDGDEDADDNDNESESGEEEDDDSESEEFNADEEDSD